MNIVVFHDCGEEKAAGRLLKMMTDADCGIKEASPFAFPSDWETETLVIGAALSGATHFLTFGESLPPWFPFAAGIAGGKDCPLVWYGTPLAHKPGYAPGLVVCKDKAALIRYLRAESAVLNKRQAFGKAREMLLDRGIPVTMESFAHYVGEGDTAVMRLFLDAGFSPDEKDKKGVPLLCIAARAGSVPAVRFLIAQQSDVNQKSGDRGNTALVDAALGKYAGLVKDLVEAGADVNAKSKDGQSALIIAVGLADIATAEILLKSGANADEPDLLGVTARKYAALFHKDEMLALFHRLAPAGN
ncbi:MAG: ankyrin repeat domain-containing protein [Spirochaetaceae bacterium]|jgi:hypothetical protein|nr:ankyrin repeat domain-containing protein [Spirochaetaceae bacterium]